jgi:hypothetical protein
LLERLLYQDHATALSSDAIVVRRFTKILGRSRRIALGDIEWFTVRDRSEFPEQRLPDWGVSHDGVWYTRDRSRWRCRGAVEMALRGGHVIGFTPAHPARIRDLLVRQGVKEK